MRPPSGHLPAKPHGRFSQRSRPAPSPQSAPAPAPVKSSTGTISLPLMSFMDTCFPISEITSKWSRAGILTKCAGRLLFKNWE